MSSPVHRQVLLALHEIWPGSLTFSELCDALPQSAHVLDIEDALRVLGSSCRFKEDGRIMLYRAAAKALDILGIEGEQ